MSGEPKTLTPPWQYYRRKGLSEMRPYVPGEDLSGISVSEADRATMAEDARWGMVTGGYIARNPKNHADQWYVAQAYFDKNLEPVVARDEAAELRAAVKEWADAKQAFDDVDLAWTNAIDAGADVHGYKAAWERALYRERTAEDALRRLAGGEGSDG